MSGSGTYVSFQACISQTLIHTTTDQQSSHTYPHLWILGGGGVWQCLPARQPRGQGRESRLELEQGAGHGGRPTADLCVQLKCGMGRGPFRQKQMWVQKTQGGRPWGEAHSDKGHKRM